MAKSTWIKCNESHFFSTSLSSSQPILFVSRPLRDIEKELDDATSDGRHVWAHLEANETCEVIHDITVVAKLRSFLLFQRRFIAQKRIHLYTLGREVQ